jgi:hypothetical protein
MGDDQGFLDRLKELQLRLIYEQKTTDAITVTMAMSRLEALSGLPEREGWVLVGEAGSMPGTDGFTMGAFHADQVPVGTKLYVAPKP